MSKLTIKGRSVQEATEPDINKAYNEFSAVLDKYNDNTANFMKDCVYIAHSRGENLVNGLRKQGYKLNLAAQLDTDTLHTCYVKEDNGVHKAIDLYFNPHRRVVEVILLGFDPDYPNAESTKIFSVQKGADAFADFIEGLSDYKGESKMKESKFKIKVHESSIEETIKQDILTAINDSDVVNELNDLLSMSSHKILDAVLKKNGVLNKNPADWEQPFYDFTMDKLVEFLKTDSNSFLQ